MTVYPLPKIFSTKHKSKMKQHIPLIFNVYFRWRQYCEHAIIGPLFMPFSFGFLKKTTPVSASNQLWLRSRDKQQTQASSQLSGPQAPAVITFVGYTSNNDLLGVVNSHTYFTNIHLDITPFGLLLKPSSNTFYSRKTTKVIFHNININLLFFAKFLVSNQLNNLCQQLDGQSN